MMILLVLGVLQTALIRPYYRNDRLKTIEVLADTIIDELLENGNVSKANTDAAFKSILNNRACAYIINDNGQIIYQSDALGATCMFSHEITLDNNTFILSKNPDYLMEALRNENTYSRTVTSEISSRDMLIYGSLIKSDLANYYLFINTELEPVDSLIGFFAKQYFLIAVLIAMIAVVISLFLTNKLSLPIVKMKKEADKLVNGDYSASFKGDSFSEINDLADTLNNATNKLSKMNELRKDLVANVSHDIKTPLTSIINYLDFLSNEERKEQPDQAVVHEYIEVLERQSVRLRKLIEDLIEASKASSGSLKVEKEPCELRIFLEQIAGEYEERLERANLTLNLSVPEEEVIVEADGRHLWRVIDNLLQNACKYAMSGTRVYLQLQVCEEQAMIVIKNVSASELNIPAEELMERFVRGDRSRHSEGSGLGLSIARSLTELQGGRFAIEIDGDLFKTAVGFPILKMDTQEISQEEI